METGEETMMRYVAGFLFAGDFVLLVRKKHPFILEGRLNGIGGKIEPTESPEAAMEREWWEETGGSVTGWLPFCVLRGFCDLHQNGTKELFVVYFFCRSLNLQLPFVYRENDVGESMSWFDKNIVLLNPDLQPNCRWLIPMAQEVLSAKERAVMYEVVERYLTFYNS